VSELREEIEKSVVAGFMKKNPLVKYKSGDNSAENYNKFDLHRPFVDDIILVSPSGKKMFREPDLIDGWFDSGAMPYAQWHYPFERKDEFTSLFPADFIAEGVDQTRGWFFTLHAIATMISDSVSSRNIVSNGLVLDKNGNKMSKRLGNAVDPFETIKKYGADPLRWYMMVNSQPWDNLKFDPEGVDEVRRKFFGTLFNTYTFFALYANIDGFNFKEDLVPVSERPEIDRWIISLLNSLIKDVDYYYNDYEPTWAARAIQDFVIDNLSNWYVRLNRKRYWGGEYSQDKLSAFQTLYTCLETLTQLMAPLAPFYAEKIFCDLNRLTGRLSVESVHHTDFPVYEESLINKALEERMGIAQKISSMVLGLRRKVNIKVRQPLNKVLIPVLNNGFQQKVEAVENLILTEINVKNLEYLTDTSEILVKKIKPNFKSLGPRFGKLMKPITAAVNQMTREDINKFEREGSYSIVVDSQTIALGPDDLEIVSEDIPGWLVASDGNITVALDITVTDDLRLEGIAREFVNRIQNYRKESGFDVTDKINISIQRHEFTNEAIVKHKEYIVSQTLAKEIILVENLDKNTSRQVEIDDDIITWLKIERIG
jgi:isoleucyl-tRNA synthetase